MISSALQIKHTPNLHYHVTKNINDLMQNKRTSKVISYKDMVMYNEEQEYMKRYYKASEETTRLKNLTEFYQYHNEIPKLHIYSLRRVLKRYHTKKRKLEYIFVRKLLGFSVNNEIMESSYEPKPNEEDSSLEKDKNKGKELVSHILRDISLYKEQSYKRIFDERKSSITFNEFSNILLNKEDKKIESKLECKDLAGMLQKLTENSFELVFKPVIINKQIQSHTESNFNFKKPTNQHQRVSSNLNGSAKLIEKVKEQPFEKKIIHNKSNTDRNYDFKQKTTRRTINLITEPINNTNPLLSPKSPVLRISTDRNTRNKSKDLLKSSSNSISKNRTSPFSAKNNNKISLNSNKNGSLINVYKNKMILSKKATENVNNVNNHLRFFSLNGYETSMTNRLEGSIKERVKSPTEIKGLKNLKGNANFLINKKLVKAHLEEFLLKGNTQGLRNSSGKSSQTGKKNNLETIQGKNTQNLFKKIYQNDLKNPNHAKIWEKN